MKRSPPKRPPRGRRPRFALSRQSREDAETAIVGAIVRRRRSLRGCARRFRVRGCISTSSSASSATAIASIDSRSPRIRGDIDCTLARLNHVAFGFKAYRSRDIAVETSRTFQVVSRFQRAIGVITIVASSVFLLCIMLLKVDERRRDVAALRLMGISARSIVRSIVIEAALVAVLGSVLGVALGGRRRRSSTGTTAACIARRSISPSSRRRSWCSRSRCRSCSACGAGLWRRCAWCARRRWRCSDAECSATLARASLVRHRSRPYHAGGARRRGRGGDAARHGDARRAGCARRSGSFFCRADFSCGWRPKCTLPFDTDATIPGVSASSPLRSNPDVRTISPVLGGSIHIPVGDREHQRPALGIDPTVQGDYELLSGRDLLRVTRWWQRTTISLAKLGAKVGDTARRRATGYDPQTRTYPGQRRLVVAGRVRFIYRAAEQAGAACGGRRCRRWSRIARDRARCSWSRLRKGANADSVRGGSKRGCRTVYGNLDRDRDRAGRRAAQLFPAARVHPWRGEPVRRISARHDAGDGVGERARRRDRRHARDRRVARARGAADRARGCRDHGRRGDRGARARTRHGALSQFDSRVVPRTAGGDRLLSCSSRARRGRRSACSP